MAEYWKSTPKYWCKQCQIYIRDTAFERTQHEATGKHQGNLKRFLRDIHRNKEREQKEATRTKNEVERLRNLVSGKPASGGATTGTDGSRNRPLASSSGPRQVTAEERKRQIAQLAEMGVAVPDEYRREMAMAGDWQTVSVTPVNRNEGDDEKARLNTGVRKRKLEETEEYEMEAEAEAARNRNVRQGWGTAMRSYPGAADDDTDDLDALLSRTKTVKRKDDADAKPEPDTADAVKQPPEEGEEEEAGLTKTNPDAAAVVKEEPDSLQSGDSLPKSESQEEVPAVIFKKRKNRAIKK